MKAKTMFYCTECGNELPKWAGQCPACKAWNTIVEQPAETKRKGPSSAPAGERRGSVKPRRMDEVETTRELRFQTGMNELDRVLGGGAVQGSLVLVGGAPGIGKSTLMLQICQNLCRFAKVLYVSGEESERQIKLRADRLHVQGTQLYLQAETNLEDILESVRELKPDILIVDSIQTLYNGELSAAPGSIGQVKPSGWHLVKYDCVDGQYLYNRCHLIGYQLTAENANECNLITGTRYLNIEGMLPFENQVADYVEQTGNHVLYRVTPVFEGDNLLASGVLMEGYSVEDSGTGICFCVYAFNVQPGVQIDYATGESALIGEAVTEPSEQTSTEEPDYVLNNNTRKFHRLNCSSVEDIKPSNREDYTGSREALIEQGYVACKRCRP